jgi:hypothetical protein
LGAEPLVRIRYVRRGNGVPRRGQFTRMNEVAPRRTGWEVRAAIIPVLAE